MRIDGAIKAIVIIAPEVLEEKLATESATRVRGEQQEQFIFLRSQIKFHSIKRYNALKFIDAERSTHNRSRGCGRRRSLQFNSTQHSSHPRQQLTYTERLGNIVISSHL